MSTIIRTNIMFAIATGLGLAGSETGFADVVIDSVTNVYDARSILKGPTPPHSDEDEGFVVTNQLETDGNDIHATSSLGDAWCHGHAHAWAEMLGDGFQFFGDSEVTCQVAAPGYGWGQGDTLTSIALTLEADLTRVSGQFCVRSGGEEAFQHAMMSFYKSGESTLPMVHVDLEGGDACRSFELLLPAGAYELRSHAWTMMDNGSGSSETLHSWSQYGGEIRFEEIADPDINDDGKVDGVDLGRFLAQWGSDNLDFDFNGDGKVDGQDLAILIGAWG
jgi:hypothetical protein